MPISGEKIAELKKLAQGVSSGPWVVHLPKETAGWGYCVGPKNDCLFQLRGRYNKQLKVANANYLAAISPDVLLAMIAEIERLQAECAQLQSDKK